MPPSDPVVRELCDKLPSTKAMLSDAQMVEVLFSGCKSSEYSYDATFGGRANGAFSKFAIDALKSLNNPTYAELYAEIRKDLPSRDYPQTPQFEGSETNKAKKIFS